MGPSASSSLLEASEPADEARLNRLLGLPRREVYAALGSSVRGLSATEAAARLAAVGPNALPAAQRRSIPAWFLRQFVDLFALMLVVAAGFTVLAYLLQSPRDPGTLNLAIAILGIVVLNAVIGFLQEYSAERTAEALQAMVPRTARVVRDGERIEVPAEQLVPGDLVVFEAGDAVSADCRLVEAHGLAMNNASLTGESNPVGRTDEPVPSSTQPVEARNCVFMGTSVVQGSAKAVVFATGATTEFGQIFGLAAEVKQVRSPLQREVAIMARRVAAVATVLGVGVFGLRSVTTSSELVESFVFALGVMVALVPEGLPATLSVSLAVGVRRMARNHALLKKLVAVETLGSATVVCSDKTGTLTQAEMTVQVLWESGRRHGVTGIGYEPAGVVEQAASALEVLRIGALCADARLVAPDGEGSRWHILGDTTEGAILVSAAKAGIDLGALSTASPRVAEFPFDSDRKLMTVVCRNGADLTALVKGSPQELLDRCESVDWDGEVRSLSEDVRAVIVAATDELAASTLRVLAVARRVVSDGAAESGAG